MSIYAVWGAPRTGKTEIAIALSKTLAREGRVVCLISAQDHAELYGKLEVNCEVGYGLAAAISSGAYAGRSAVEVENEHGLFLLSATPFNSVLDLIFTKEQALNLLTGSASNFQDVIVDCTSTLNSAISGEALSLADKVIVPIAGNFNVLYWYFANENNLSSLRHKSVYVRNCTVKKFDYITLEKALKLPADPACIIPHCKVLPDLISNGDGLLEGGAKWRDSFHSLMRRLAYA